MTMKTIANRRAKTPAALLMAASLIACFFIQSVPVAICAAILNCVLSLAIAGSKDKDAERRMFGGAPSYWSAAAIWCGTVAVFTLMANHGPGAPWVPLVIMVAGWIQAAANLHAQTQNL